LILSRCSFSLLCNEGRVEQRSFRQDLPWLHAFLYCCSAVRSYRQANRSAYLAPTKPRRTLLDVSSGDDESYALRCWSCLLTIETIFLFGLKTCASGCCLTRNDCWTYGVVEIQLGLSVRLA